jgi:hypothetical protein
MNDTRLAPNATPACDISSDNPLSRPCPQCESADLTDRHCKLICENCGYVESCEDLF